MSRSPDLNRIIKPHVDNLNGLFNRTISDSRLDSQTYRLNPAYHQIARRVGGHYAHVELSRGALEFSQIITERSGRPHVVEAVYIYWLNDTNWVFRYEYDTRPMDDKPHSHLHVNGRSESVPDLQKIHFPAGRLSVEHLIYHLVTEHGVTCRLAPVELIEELRTSYRRWERTDQRLFP